MSEPDQNQPDPTEEEESGLDAIFNPSSPIALGDIDKKIFNLELANPNISIRQINKILGVDREVVSRIKKNQVYIRALAEARKNEYDILADIQVLAAQKIKNLIDSKDESIALRAATFALHQTQTIKLEKAKAELALELQERARKTVTRHVVKVVYPMGMSVITPLDNPIERYQEEAKNDLKELSDSVEKRVDSLICDTFDNDKE